jgi:branched-chain amino acid transport system ATP-binding protein
MELISFSNKGFAQTTDKQARHPRKRVELGRALALNHGSAAPRADGRDEPGREGGSPLRLQVNQQWGTTVILIEHDMAVVMDISEHVTVLDRTAIARAVPVRCSAIPR